MRDYGVIRCRFWPWAKRKGLSPTARELALYMLTSPHSTAIGAYYCPLAYIADDLGTVPQTVKQTVSELSAIGFLTYDENTSWVWICDFLDHNPIANPNVGKSLVGFIESIPGEAQFFQGLIAKLKEHDNRFPNGFINRIANRSRNGLGNGMPNQDHEQEQDHEQDHDHDHAAEEVSVELALTNGTAAAPAQQVFDAWCQAAKRHGWPAPRALTADRRKHIRGRIKDAGAVEAVVQVITRAEGNKFLREEMKVWSLDWLLKPANFLKVLEGNYDRDFGERPKQQGPIEGTVRGALAANAAPSKGILDR